MRAIFLDIETTGLDPIRHRTIDIAFKVVDVTSGYHIKPYHALVRPAEDHWERRDPISMEINGFTWEQVSTGKEPHAVGKEIIEIFTDLQIERGKAVFICQNPAFDRSFFNQLVDVYTQEGLNWPYHWLDLASMFWTLLAQKSKEEGMLFPEQIIISKNEIARHYNLAPEMKPHRAMKGVDHLIQCYEAVLGVKFKG